MPSQKENIHIGRNTRKSQPHPLRWPTRWNSDCDHSHTSRTCRFSHWSGADNHRGVSKKEKNIFPCEPCPLFFSAVSIHRKEGNRKNSFLGRNWSFKENGVCFEGAVSVLLCGCRSSFCSGSLRSSPGLQDRPRSHLPPGFPFTLIFSPRFPIS